MKPKAPKKKDPKPNCKTGEVKRTFRSLPVLDASNVDIITINFIFDKKD